ncbi:hypothetical protein ACFX13_044602 [Malus domestica]
MRNKPTKSFKTVPLPQDDAKTPLFNLKLYAVIAILVLCLIPAALLIFLCLCITRVSRKRKMRVKHSSGSIPLFSKKIAEIKEPSPRTTDNGERKCC